MKSALLILVPFLLFSSPAQARDCYQTPTYGDCSRNNEHYRHGKDRSRREPHYQLHNRAQSKREGFHERADSYRKRGGR